MAASSAVGDLRGTCRSPPWPDRAVARKGGRPRGSRGDTKRCMVSTSLSEKKFQKAVARARHAQARLSERYPGDSGARQPVHTVYGGAHLFTSDTASKFGELALRALETYAPDAAAFGEAIGIASELAPTVYER